MPEATPATTAPTRPYIGGQAVLEGVMMRSPTSFAVVVRRADGSLHVRLPGGTPIALGLTDADGKALDFEGGAPFTGPMRQRETMQFYPGERAKQSMPAHLFDGICAGCHGSVSGRELDVGVDVDVLTSASVTTASDAVVDLR